MPALKNIGIVAGLVTGGSGVASGIAYSLGAFHPSIQVSELIKNRNIHILLVSDGNNDVAGWNTSWQAYKAGNHPWGKITEGSNSQVPTEFKDLCKTKVKELVYGTNDKKYEEIVKYCARKKTIKDVLSEVNFGLLSTDGSGNTAETWKSRFTTYNATTNKLKLPNDNISGTDNQNTGYTKLKDACAATIKLETTVDDYANVLKAVREWCKA